MRRHKRPLHRLRKAEKDPESGICVLPFANMSGDPEQEYFSDGITEDIITDLSKVSALSIVSRNTSFSFKGTKGDGGRSPARPRRRTCSRAASARPVTACASPRS